MDILRTFLEQQPLLSMFLVVGLGYALGRVNIRGFARKEDGAVLFVGLAAGMNRTYLRGGGLCCLPGNL